MNYQIKLRKLNLEDCREISLAFKSQDWNKPVNLYMEYLKYQESGQRDIIIAEMNGIFAGYLTIKWESDYLPFKEKNIPEIVDFNVLKKFQRKGIGTRLMSEAERRIKKVSNCAGIGFGVYQDYGAAQILYIKRNYIPDGNGIVKNSLPIKYGQEILIDDGVVMYFTKEL